MQIKNRKNKESKIKIQKMNLKHKRTNPKLNMSEQLDALNRSPFTRSGSVVSCH